MFLDLASASAGTMDLETKLVLTDTYVKFTLRQAASNLDIVLISAQTMSVDTRLVLADPGIWTLFV